MASEVELEGRGDGQLGPRKGMTVRYTPKGMPYLEREEQEGKLSEEDQEAMDEHKVEKLSVWISLDEVERRYGVGTRLYFNYLKFIIACNLILFLLAFIPWISFMASPDRSRTVMNNFPNRDYENPLLSGSGSQQEITRPLELLEMLFISAYTNSQYGLWLSFNILAVLSWFCFGPIYLLSMNKAMKNAHVDDHDNPFAFTGMALDLIPGNDHFTATNRFLRRCVSYGVFCSGIGASATAIYFVQDWGSDPERVDDLISSLFVTSIISGINFAWTLICGKLTDLERHKSWSNYRKHHTIKLYGFKVINVSVMYIAARFAFAQDHVCPLEDAGYKFLFLIITDLLVFNSIEIAMPVVKLWLRQNVKKLQGTGGDESVKPEFNVAEEYLELLYRQFVVYLGMTVFPMVTFLALICNILEYPMDKFRMLRICQRPVRLEHSMKNFLMAFMLTTALAGMLSFPNGAVWILSGFDRVKQECELFLPKPSQLF